jgi:multimeric flavodoxin WrbA
MRAVLLADVQRDDVLSAHARDVAARELLTRGATVAAHDVTMLDVAACVGCFDCWTTTPGRCRFRDDGDRLVREVVNANVLVLVGPVTFGGYAARLKRVVDRLLPVLSPMLSRREGELHRRARYATMPSLVAIGTQPLPDAEPERLFRTLVERNALHLHAPAWSAAVLDASMTAAARRSAIQAALATVGRGVEAHEAARTTGPTLLVRP